MDREPTYSSPGGPSRPVISTAAAHELREALKKTDSLDALGIATVKLQLKKWEEAQKQAAAVSDALGSKFGVDFDKLKFEGRIGAHPVKDAEVWTWKKLPYAVRCAGVARRDDEADEGEVRGKKKARVEGGEDLVADVDEWILQNEVHLRTLTRKAKIDSPGKEWKHGLINADDLSTVLPTSEPVKDNGDVVALEVQRQPVGALPGFSFLELKRRDTAYVQPSSAAVHARWESMTGGLFKGLDWANVCVAGGLILGALLTPDLQDGHAGNAAAHKAEEWATSDIDVYIHGLGPEAANSKIAHIADVVRGNLPKDAPFLLVRNSQTITLYSKFPTRRVQIVLKLVESPREVLLNFDLDICAVAFDGSDAWMLPRCARALETGTVVFTMDLIEGHFLGDRKASRDKRVFKYANKGFGIRILPSYLATLSTYATSRPNVHARGERLIAPPYNLQDMADGARVGHASAWSTIRNWTMETDPSIGRSSATTHRVSETSFSHAMLESRGQRTSEPLIRSCLTSFTLFLRHVALWEEEAKGKSSQIKEDLWAAETYGEGLAIVAYDDTPAYTWDTSFNVEDFKKAIDAFNQKEGEGFGQYALEETDVPAARITYATTVAELLDASHDICIPLFLGKSFMAYAQEVIDKALKAAKLQLVNPVFTAMESEESGYEMFGQAPVLWRLDKLLNWQMVDRRIDEVREALWSYHPEDTIYQMLQTNLSRRAIRTSVPDEMGSFVRWVGRKPYETSTIINAHFVYGYEGEKDEVDRYCD
ncbi:hypothetical protein BD626DRAFT_616231 [Schizophyllum amplum]|uniref:Uncharacterized protein n=1 Tax=Schizophyllum amplum TaxID=97359 RepID=A0A550CL83_9AGAR|nr:hypothetical protein BD626DRAFT_616231 [Auriculariopsis ampla]